MRDDLPLILTIAELEPILRCSIRSIERALATGCFPIEDKTSC